MIARRIGIVLLIWTCVLFIALPVTPAAAASCSGTGCSGQDPYTTGCTADAYVVNSASIYDANTSQFLGDVYLLWSSSCHTAWTEVYSSSLPRVSASISTTPYAGGEAYSDWTFGTGMANSPMVYPHAGSTTLDASFASACGAIDPRGDTWDGPSGGYACVQE